MAASPFGVFLKFLREQRTFSLRDLSQLSGVDHAYIYRLEIGEKEAPSEEVIAKLIKNLKAGAREAQILRFLASNPGIDNFDLILHAGKDVTVTPDELAAGAYMRFRGNARPSPEEIIKRVREVTQG